MTYLYMLWHTQYIRLYIKGKYIMGLIRMHLLLYTIYYNK